MKLVASVVGGAAASLVVLVGFALVDGQSPEEIVETFAADPVLIAIVTGSGGVSGAVGALING